MRTDGGSPCGVWKEERFPAGSDSLCQYDGFDHYDGSGGNAAYRLWRHGRIDHHGNVFIPKEQSGVHGGGVCGADADVIERASGVFRIDSRRAVQRQTGAEAEICVLCVLSGAPVFAVFDAIVVGTGHSAFIGRGKECA